MYQQTNALIVGARTTGAKKEIPLVACAQMIAPLGTMSLFVQLMIVREKRQKNAQL
jgi:hypothetical protein